MTVKAVSKVRSMQARLAAERLDVNSQTVRKPNGRVNTWYGGKRIIKSNQRIIKSNQRIIKKIKEIIDNPDKGAAKTHSKDGGELFKGNTWRREVEACVVPRRLSCRRCLGILNISSSC